MTTPAETPQPTSAPTLEGPPGSPSAAIVPGAVLLFAGLWMVTDADGPLIIGWACVTVGLALLLAGVIAAGVAWGLRLDAHRRG